MRNRAPIRPKQAIFIKLYTDPKSLTFENAMQSALKAGYRKSYARVIRRLWRDQKIEDKKGLAYEWAPIFEEARTWPDWAGG